MKENKLMPEQFCYWLQGLLEVGDPKTLNAKQIAIIKEHLNLVFEKVTSDIDLDDEDDYPPPCGPSFIADNSSFDVPIDDTLICANVPDNKDSTGFIKTGEANKEEFAEKINSVRQRTPEEEKRLQENLKKMAEPPYQFHRNDWGWHDSLHNRRYC